MSPRPFIIEFEPLHDTVARFHILFPTTPVLARAEALGASIKAHSYAAAQTVPAISIEFADAFAAVTFRLSHPPEHIRPNFLRAYLEQNGQSVEGSFDELAERAVALWEAADASPA